MSNRRPKFHKPVDRSIEPGVYEVTVGQAEMKESRTGKDMLVLTLRTPGGARLKEHFVCVESCAWKLALFLDAVGVQLNEGDDINPEDYVGRTARVHIDNKVMPDGAIFGEVKKWLPKPTRPQAVAESAAPPGEGLS